MRSLSDLQDRTGSSLLALTSLSPDPASQAVQKDAIRSWVEAGLTPISFNHPTELEALSGYDGVDFVPVTASEVRRFGRHYIPIQHMTDYLAALDGAAMIINSDIVLRWQPWKLRRAALVAEGGLGCVIRHNHEGLLRSAKPERYGIDAFLLHSRNAAVVAESFLCMGKPFWDYWLPCAFEAKGLPIFRVREPVAFHRSHTQRWSSDDWDVCAMEFDRLTGLLRHHPRSEWGAASWQVRKQLERRFKTIPEEPPPVRNWLTHRFRGGAQATFLELGSYDGADSLWLASIPGVTLHAFEADLRNQSKPNRPNVIVNHKAVWSRDGKAPLFPSLEGWGRKWTQSSSLRRPLRHLERYPVTFGDCVDVDTVTLESYAAARSIDVVDFIWASVQGAEREVIEGARGLLERTRYLYTKFSDDELYEGQATLREILALLPGWRVIELYPTDVLLENMGLSR